MDSRPELDDFFAGVDEVRAYLDRHLHDPERHQERLSRIARELLRPRTARSLVSWLLIEVWEALGATAAAAWVLVESSTPDASSPAVNSTERPAAPAKAVLGGDASSATAGRWDCWARRGSSDPVPPDALGPDDPKQLWVVLPGSSGPLARLWVSLPQPLDANTLRILEALAGAAGMMLEQALRAEALAVGG